MSLCPPGQSQILSLLSIGITGVSGPVWFISDVLCLTLRCLPWRCPLASLVHLLEVVCGAGGVLAGRMTHLACTLLPSSACELPFSQPQQGKQR